MSRSNYNGIVLKDLGLFPIGPADRYEVLDFVRAIHAHLSDQFANTSDADTLRVIERAERAIKYLEK